MPTPDSLPSRLRLAASTLPPYDPLAGLLREAADEIERAERDRLISRPAWVDRPRRRIRGTLKLSEPDPRSLTELDGETA